MGDDREPTDLLIAGLIGAALGAGLGLLAARAMAEEVPPVVSAARRLRKRAGRAIDRTPSVRDVGSAVSQVVEDARERVEQAVQRELRQMQRAMRRRRRELGV